MMTDYTIIVSAINEAANLIVVSLACVCFWLGFNSWESSQK